MAHSIITYEGDGVTTQYALNFTLGFLSREDVQCRVNDEVDGLGDPAYRTLTWITDGLVEIQGDVPEDGDSIVFTRTVDKTALVHDYENGDPIEESNLDESNKQTMMAVHEFLDGRIESFSDDLDMTGFKITNMAPGTESGDAVEYDQFIAHDADVAAALAAAQAAQVAAELAEAHAETAEANAETAEANAETAETNAEAALAAAIVARDAAIAARVAAETAETNAETAETNAEIAEANAETAETNAEAAQAAAEAARDLAEDYRDAALVAQTAAELAETNAEAAQVAAEAARDIARSATGFTYTYSTTTASADPGSGVFRLNHATLASATALYISETTGLAQAVAGELATWDDSTSTIHGKLRIFLQSDPTNYRIYDVTGTLTDNGTWDTFTISHVAGNGAWANNDVMTLQYLRTGDKGDAGPTGSPGSLNVVAAAGTVDAITANYTPDISLSDLTVVGFVATGKNTVTNPSFTPDGLTTRTITKVGGGALAVGDIPAAGFVALVEYNLANTRWELLNPASGYIVGLTALTTPAIDDSIAIYDLSATTNLKITTSDFFKVINVLTAEASPPAIGDKFPMYDISASNADYVTTQILFNAISVLPSEATIAIGDTFPMYDLSATNADSVTTQVLWNSQNVLSALTAPDVADTTNVYDASASAATKLTLADFFKVINTLTQDSSPDAAADYVVTYDASASAAKKVLLSAIGSSDVAGIQVFTGNGTYTRSAGVKRALMIATGGGAGGGGADTTANGSETASGGGEAGGTSIKMLDVTAISSATVVVGGAGTGGSTAGGDGTSGGDSYVWDGVSVTYVKGMGATDAGSGTGSAAALGTTERGGSAVTRTGGTATGDLLLGGGAGDSGKTDAAGGNAQGGLGGTSFWGGSGYGGIVKASAFYASPNTSESYGAGGPGTACTATTGNAGGTAAPGVVFIIEFK